MSITAPTTFRQTSKQKPQTALKIGIIAPPQNSQNHQIFRQALEAMCGLGFKVSVLAEGCKESQKTCFEMLENHPQNFELLESVPQNKENILKNSDFLIFTENPAKNLLAEVISKNIVCVLPEGNGINDFDLKKEAGEGFTFSEGNLWSLVAAMVRASENFKFPYDWKTIKHNLSLIVF